MSRPGRRQLHTSRTPQAGTGGQPPPAESAIHVGLTNYAKGLGLALDKFDDDGFVIRVADGGPVVIAARTPWGAEFGICEFLERYVGVRWLMPGPDGDDVPEHKTIVVPAGEVRQEPAFFSRQFSGLSGPQALWARRNRMHARVSFHHNLQKLIAPEKYSRAHPEFFPIRGGKRYIPPDSNTHGWQPCFSAAGIVEAAVTDICRHFDAHPDDTSYSLGVVDSSGHCECQKCQAQDPPEKNFLGRRDCSDRYYDWCNRVVEGVLRKHPDKWFGCLAYSEVAQAPSRVKVHPRIIPYMTYDRMKWADRNCGPRATDDRSLAGRQSRARLVRLHLRLGLLRARVWFHAMGETYRYAHAHGVRAMYAEPPQLGRGPKLYLSLKLQWTAAERRRPAARLVRPGRRTGRRRTGRLLRPLEDFWTRRSSGQVVHQARAVPGVQPGRLPGRRERPGHCQAEKPWTASSEGRDPQAEGQAGAAAAALSTTSSAVPTRASRPPGPALSAADTLRCWTWPREADMAAKRRRLVAKLSQASGAAARIDFSGTRGERRRLGLGLHLGRLRLGRQSQVRDRLRDLADPAKPTSLAARSMLVCSTRPRSRSRRIPPSSPPTAEWPPDWSRWVSGAPARWPLPAGRLLGQAGRALAASSAGAAPDAPGARRYVAAAMVRVPKPLKGGSRSP